MASVVTADGAVRIFHSVIAAMAVTAAMVVIAVKPGTLSVANRPAHAGLFFLRVAKPMASASLHSFRIHAVAASLRAMPIVLRCRATLA